MLKSRSFHAVIKMKKIGIDFDNTIVNYDEAFYLAAFEKDLIPKNIDKNKKSIRDYLRSIDKEDDWTQLQGYIYGKRMDLAKPFEGINTFFSHQKENKIYIISHKTVFPYQGPKYNLHQEAKNWLLKQSFYKNDIEVFFELTLKNKLKKIGELFCDYFIDDLPEVLSEKEFPENVKKILFDPNNQYEKNSQYLKAESWQEILDIINEK